MTSKSNATLVSIACLSLLGLLMSGCALGPRPRTSYEANNQVLALNQVVVFQNSAGSLSYHAPTGKDVRVKVAPRVKGKACQHGIQIPLFWEENTRVSLSAGWGQGAYAEALSEAREGLPPDAVLYDMRADLNHLSILTIYRRQCLWVDAAVAVPVASEGAPSAAPVPVPPPATGVPPSPAVNEPSPAPSSEPAPSLPAPPPAPSEPAKPAEGAVPAAPAPPGASPTSP